MCVFVFSISTPSGNICMSVRGCKVADRTALIHQLKHTYTHTHLLSPSTIHTHIHMPLFGHTQKWSSHNFSYLHLVCILYPSCSISFITQTHTHTHTRALSEVSRAEERVCVRHSGNRASMFSLLPREPACNQHTIRTSPCLPCRVCMCAGI